MIRSISLAVLLTASRCSAQHVLLQVDPSGLVQGLIPGGEIVEAPPAGWRWVKVPHGSIPARDAFTSALTPTMMVSGTTVLRRPAADIIADTQAARRRRARASLFNARARLDAIAGEQLADPSNADLETARAEAQADVDRLRQESRP